MGVLRPCGLAAALWVLRPCRLVARSELGFISTAVLRLCGLAAGGLAARSELGAVERAGWLLEALWLPAASWRLYGGVEAVRAGCPQRVGGFIGVLRPCGLAAGVNGGVEAARSRLEVFWEC